MKIRMFKKKLKVGGGVSEDHELKVGEYNEFYLPSVNRDEELWVIVTDDGGNETKLHLKR